MTLYFIENRNSFQLSVILHKNSCQNAKYREINENKGSGLKSFIEANTERKITLKVILER